jgi:uncharacterized protein (TIRG00374 family)
MVQGDGTRTAVLFAAIAIFPITYLLTGLRWYLLLQAVGHRHRPARAFIINMVGAFYNTFLPGSTGGDMSRPSTPPSSRPNHRTRAVMTVLIDRVIGLLGLIILGGAMAAYWRSRRTRRTIPSRGAARRSPSARWRSSSRRSSAWSSSTRRSSAA